MNEPLWATGPGEILRHGIGLLRHDSDTNRRLAMIGIDNSVELMMKTYIALPSRVTGLTISRREREEICSSFPALLDGIERYAGDKLTGVSLAEIEWFHQLRNQLYHQGNGLTVERKKGEAYAELANLLFKNLFGFGLAGPRPTVLRDLGEFMNEWSKLQKTVSSMAPAASIGRQTHALFEIFGGDYLTAEELKEFDKLRRYRNAIAHGDESADAIREHNLTARLKTMRHRIEEIAKELLAEPRSDK